MDVVNWIPVDLVARIIVELLFSSEQNPAASGTSQSNSSYSGSNTQAAAAEKPSNPGFLSVSDGIEDRPWLSQTSQRITDEDYFSDNPDRHKETETAMDKIQTSDGTVHTGPHRP